MSGDLNGPFAGSVRWDESVTCEHEVPALVGARISQLDSVMYPDCCRVLPRRGRMATITRSSAALCRGSGEHALWLKERIQAAMVMADHLDDREHERGHPHRLFLPNHKLLDLITTDVMSTYLPQDRLLARACDLEEPMNAKTCHSRKIFAILLLVEKVEAITTFIAEGVDDNSLPICFKPRWDGDAKLHSERPLDRAYPSLYGLDQGAAASFVEWQWAFLTPVFSAPNPRTSEAAFHGFHENTVLPIIRAEYFHSGAFGTVYRVEIHQDYISSYFGLNDKVRQALTFTHSHDPIWTSLKYIL